MEPADAPPPPADAAADRPPAPDGGLRILLVEDDRDIARVLALLLARSGHEVEIARGVAEAVRKAAGPGRFDLLISDLNLPDGSGLDLIRRIGPIPGIAISGFSTDIDLRECLDAGFLDLFGKPVEFSALREAIRRIAGGTGPARPGP